MQKQPDLTITMIVRNEEKYMASAIQSLLCQTYSGFILVIVNNGSTDTTGEIADSYAKQDKRITVIHIEQNDPAITYKVIDSIQTPYYMFAAGHDFYEPTFIEKCLAALEEDPSVVLAYPRASWFKDDKIIGEIPGVFDTRGMNIISRAMVVSYGLVYAYQFYGIYRLAPFKSLRRLHVVGADHVLLTELALIGPFALINEPLFFMRQSDNEDDLTVYRDKHHPGEPDGIGPFLKMTDAYMSFAVHTADFHDQILLKLAFFTMNLLRSENVLEMFGESKESLFARPGFANLAASLSQNVISIEGMARDECNGRSNGRSQACESGRPRVNSDLEPVDINRPRQCHGQDLPNVATELNKNTPNLRKGRCVTDSYARGWGLQYGDLRQRVREDKLFQEAIQFEAGRSIVSEDNKMNIFLIIRDYLKEIDFGHIVEFGSYKGGTSLFMAYLVARLYPGMRVYAFDTFSGMPETDTSIDAHRAGEFSDVNLGELRRFAETSGLVNIEFVQGLFEQTAPLVLPNIGDICLAHIDCDIYSAVSYSYKAVKPFMVPGGYLIFDDATYSSCLGATEAVEDFVIRQDGLNSEQIFPQFVFRAPKIWRELDVPFSITGQNSQTEYSEPLPYIQQPIMEPIPSTSNKAKIKIAGEVATSHDLTMVGGESQFARSIAELFASVRPKIVIETGTYLGEGTTQIIANTLQRLEITDAAFYTIECNPDHFLQAQANLARLGLIDRVHMLHGISVPRSKLPTLQQIEQNCVNNIEFDDIYIDHQEQQRALLYYKETDFFGVEDDLLGKVLDIYSNRPDFVLLDSGGHMGNVEFNYLISRLKGPCYLALDDIFHIKHHKSFRQMQVDPRFDIITVSKEKFGFCLAKFTPDPPSVLKDINRIIWFRPDSIGDNVLAASMLPHIRKKYAAAHITVVCRDHIAEIYEACPFVDEIISFDHSKIIADDTYRNDIIAKLKELEADLLLNSVYSRESITDVIALSCGAKTTIALDGDCSNITNQEKELNNKQYTCIIPSPEERCLELDRHRDFLKGIGINSADLKLTFDLKESDVAAAEKIFTMQGFIPEKTIVIFAGAQHDIRLYDQYGAALAELCKEHDLSAIALGAANDFVINENNLKATGVTTLNLSGKLSLQQSAAIISRCRLAIGAETGLAHIACAVGTPNVILLGGGHFGRFLPYSPLTSVVCLPLECYGCNWACKYPQPYCIQGVSTEVLKQAIKQTLAGTSQYSRVFIQSIDRWLPPLHGPMWRQMTQYIVPLKVKLILV